MHGITFASLNDGVSPPLPRRGLAPKQVLAAHLFKESLMKRYFASSVAVLSVALVAFAQDARTQRTADDHPGHHGTKLTKSLIHCMTECTFCSAHCAKLIGEGK